MIGRENGREGGGEDTHLGLECKDTRVNGLNSGGCGGGGIVGKG